MSNINKHGIIVPKQDLNGVPSDELDDGRLYQHDGSSTLTLTTGATSTNTGYYIWDEAASAWDPQEVTITDSDTLDGLDSTDFVKADGSVAMTGDLTIGGGNLRGLDDIFSGSPSSAIRTNGVDGTDEWGFYDDFNKKWIAHFYEGGNVSFPGGNVEIQNGQLIQGGTSSDVLNANAFYSPIVLETDGTETPRLQFRAKTQDTKIFGDDAGTLHIEGENKDDSLRIDNSNHVYVPNGSVTQGNDPRDTITETTSPTSFNFDGSKDRDIHRHADLTISNGTTASVTEDITVELFDGVDTTGTLLQSETQSVTVAAGGSSTVRFINTDKLLDTGTYHIEITTSGTALAIDQTDEQTAGATYALQQTATGQGSITDQFNRDVLRFDPITDDVDVPSGQLSEQGARVATRTYTDNEILTHAGDASAHHTKYTNTEARTAVEGSVDAADLTGASGLAGQVLESDGTNAAWADVSGSGFDGTAANLSITEWEVIDVGNEGFPGDQTGGDLAAFMRSKITSTSKTLFVLPGGTYDWSSPIIFNDGIGTNEVPRPAYFGIIGKPDATLHVAMPTTGVRNCFRFGNSTTGIEKVMLKNLHFDIGVASDTRDAGIMRCYIEDFGYFEDLTITRRKRIQDDGTTKNGDRQTFKLDCIQQDATAVVHRVKFPDGDVFQGAAASVGHAIPFSSEEFHVGTTHWEDCYVEGFTDNGFYLRDGAGSNYVKACTAKDCAAGMFRLGINDHAENITMIATAPPYNCTPLWIQHYRDGYTAADQDLYTAGEQNDRPAVVDGFEIIATGEPVNDIIRVNINPGQVTLKNGYIRCEVDDYVIDASSHTGKLKLEEITVDDLATGLGRVAALNVAQDNVTIDGLTYRADPPDLENGRSVFAFNGKNITLRDSDILGAYHPLIESYAGADFTIENCKFPHDGSVANPYIIRNNDTGTLSYVSLRNNDFTAYTGGLNIALSEFDAYHIMGNEGLTNADQRNVWTDNGSGYEIQKDGTDGTGVINFKTV